MKQQTVDLIIRETFKLFAYNRYEQVTVSDIERATKLTRGAIFYYMSNKEHLFKEVADKYIFSQELISKCDKTNLSTFIHCFINQLHDLKKQMKVLGIKNANFSYVNIVNEAIYYYPDYLNVSKQKEKEEFQTWVDVVQNAVSTGEIKKSTNIELTASLFYHLYAGFSYKGIILPDGINIEQLESLFTAIYQAIKN